MKQVVGSWVQVVGLNGDELVGRDENRCVLEARDRAFWLGIGAGMREL